MTTDAKDTNRAEIAAEFLRWIAIARVIVSEHFPSERAEPHNQIVIETARSLMIAQRLGDIDKTLGGLSTTLAQTKET